MKTAFVTDSGTGESMEVLSRDGIYSLPLQISCGEESYQDSVDITSIRYMKRCAKEPC